MFARDPRLQIDQLVGQGEAHDYQPYSWVTRHQEELRDTHKRAADKLAREADVRKKYNKHPRMKLLPQQFGQQVLVRARTIRGQNKIQDQWGTRVHKVVEQLDNGTYVIEPAEGHGSTRVVNQAELHMCPPTPGT